MNFFDNQDDDKVINQIDQINKLIEAADGVIDASNKFRSAMNNLNVSQLPLKKSDQGTIDYASVAIPSSKTLETLKRLLTKAAKRYEVEENEDGMTHF